MKFWDHVAQEQHYLTFNQSNQGPVGLIYPNAYSVGMASLGFQQIYRLFRESGIAVERVFFDKKGRETRSIENHTPLFRFPVLAASYTYELDIVNLLKMLLCGGVEPLSESRQDGAPVIIIGGQAATANPALLQPFADAVVLGEGEETIAKISAALITTHDKSRDAILQAMAEIPSIYVPRIHGDYSRDQFTRNVIDPLEQYPCHSVIRANNDEFGGSFLLEVSRGCNYRCKFCIVHYQNGSARYRSFDSLIDILEKHQNQFLKVGLLGAAVADHPQIEDITEWLTQHGKQVGTSSLRAEKVTERFLDLLKLGGQQTLTIAPETGSLANRKTLLKGVKDEKYFQLAEWMGQRRFHYLKLYFLIGIPGADPMLEANDIIEFSQTIGDIFCKAGGSKVTVAVSPFVPKPSTPWENEPLWEPKKIKKASRIIRKQLAFRGNMKVPPVNVKEARIETILSRFGAELKDELLQLAHGESTIENAFNSIDIGGAREI